MPPLVDLRAFLDSSMSAPLNLASTAISDCASNSQEDPEAGPLSSQPVAALHKLRKLHLPQTRRRVARLF